MPVSRSTRPKLVFASYPPKPHDGYKHRPHPEERPLGRVSKDGRSMWTRGHPSRRLLRKLLRMRAEKLSETLRMRPLEFRVIDRLMPIERACDRRQRVFKPCGAIEQHHPVVFRNAPIGEAFLVGGIGRRPLRTQ